MKSGFPCEIKVVDHSYEIIRQNGVTTLAAFPIGVDVDKILSEVSDGKRLEYTFEEEDLYERILADKEKGRNRFRRFGKVRLHQGSAGETEYFYPGFQ